MKSITSLFLLALCALCGSKTFAADPPENFKRENLVAWCIVPFDAKKRGPAERAELLVDLGLERVAYDWRAEHISAFEEEILQYKKRGIEYFAFWNEHEDAFALFEKYDLHPQIWKTNPSPPAESQGARIAAAAKAMLPLARRATEMGCKLGLYNHGGWGGEPENLVAVCERLNAMLRAEGASLASAPTDSRFTLVGIVYNFHHGHEHVDRFVEAFELMKPYLLCLNLNGMAGPETVAGKENKILPVGSGKHEKAMIKAVIESGYSGPIGVLGHITEQDVRKSLADNLEGLERVLADLK